MSRLSYLCADSSSFAPHPGGDIRIVGVHGFEGIEIFNGAVFPYSGMLVSKTVKTVELHVFVTVGLSEDPVELKSCNPHRPVLPPPCRASSGIANVSRYLSSKWRFIPVNVAPISSIEPLSIQDKAQAPHLNVTVRLPATTKISPFPATA
ncbi:hypothetical protein [Methanoculleus chikugoensis]|uniref:hypothetical protein n=1 Tax=Methanoculleus chikugoensis TaxID=118126 RepID=UPI001FB55892|nr:hypothetical protein [Methanoculleus chikugoensis]